MSHFDCAVILPPAGAADGDDLASELVLGIMAGLEDREAQAEMAAESAIREMEAGR